MEGSQLEGRNDRQWMFRQSLFNKKKKKKYTILSFFHFFFLIKSDGQGTIERPLSIISHWRGAPLGCGEYVGKYQI
jgi:hypothetical protein